MNFWIINIKGNKVGYPYCSSNKDLLFYKEIFPTFNSKESAIEHWKPTMVCYLHYVDFGKVLYANQEAWVFTENAKNLLSDLLQNNVEYLQLYSRNECHKKIGRLLLTTRRKIFKPIVETVHTEKQHLINILNIKTSEVLDFEQSDFDYNEDDGMIYGVNKLVFKPDKIKDCHIFKINNLGIYFQTATFVSEEFKDIVEQNGFSGVEFEEC